MHEEAKFCVTSAMWLRSTDTVVNEECFAWRTAEAVARGAGQGGSARQAQRQAGRRAQEAQGATAGAAETVLSSSERAYVPMRLQTPVFSPCAPLKG